MPPIRSQKTNLTQQIRLNIQKTTINKIWKDKQKWLSVLFTSQFSHTFCQRSVQFSEVDKAMQIWTSQAIAAGLPLSDMILQQKGLEFAKMFNMDDKLKCANEEANSAPIESLPEEHVCLHALLAKYDKEDIYNADEIGLFFRMESNQTLGTSPTLGYKMDKNRISIFFCTNATGNHKFRPLVIGKSFNPRCFKNFNKSALSVTYQANSKT
ncbi:tigger transposable element-derived protein 6-like [Rhizophagus irregularis DAOM 181602=DAOM 197198]|nr:tigger transposable element-derived protein 6-like [Rhizophagus irregularis DAOM 181602=DAOM 197198]